VVVLTSDHGEQFGEHGLIQHGNSLYLPLLHVPLVFLAPGRVPPGRRVAVPVSLRDLPLTLLDLAGTPNPGLPGKSLAAYWGPDSLVPRADTMFSAVDYHRLLTKWPPSPLLQGSMRSIVLDSLHYVRNGDGTEQLFYPGKDFLETRNLSRSPEFQAALEAYRGALWAQLQRGPGRVAHR